MVRKRRVGRPRKKKKALKSKKYYQRKLKRATKGKRKRRLPPRVKSGKNKGRFRKRK